MNVTQKDIAKTLGVSVSLVSRALNGKGAGIGASDYTIRRILQTAKSLRYVPSVAARSLRGGPTRTVGVVVFDFDDPFFNTVISFIQKEAHKRKLSTVLVGFEHRKVESGDTEPLFRYRLDAVIVVGSGPVEGWISPFMLHSKRVIQIGGGRSSRGVIQVTVDNAKGIALIAEHLFGAGHRRFAFIGPETVVSLERYRILLDELGKRGVDKKDVVSEMVRAQVYESGYDACRKVIQKHAGNLPTAIVGASDAVAMGALRALQESGIRVPADVSLTGFDDIIASRMTVPALTTIQHPIRETVEKAMDMAMYQPVEELCSSPFLTEPVLITRESTAPVLRKGREDVAMENRRERRNR